jgi:hypothetical protein
MQSDIEKIIKDGCLAPSGENCQPWKFVVKEDTIRVYNLPEADKSLYNSKQKGTYVAHGALIENMVLSAAQSGYAAVVELFPSSNEPDLVSVLVLKKATPKSDALYPYLEKRCTNRKDFNGAKLSDDQKIMLIAAADAGAGELRLVDDEASLKKLGNALAVNEKVIFENKLLHDFFYGHILWKENEQDKAGGFYVKTLEFLPHQLKGVELFKNWVVLKIMNKLVGASKMIVKENAEKYAKSGTLAAIVMNGDANKDFVNAGRAVQRTWLAAARLGLSAHPCTGVVYFNEQIKDGGAANFSKEHLALIASSYQDVASAFGANGQTIPMLWRIGFAEDPTARSMRMPPNIAN